MSKITSLEVLADFEQTCEHCKKTFFVKRGKGIYPKYCGTNCKQKAYRLRKKKEKGEMVKPDNDKLALEGDIIRLAKAHAKSQDLDINFVVERLLAKWLNGDVKSLQLKGKG